MNARFTVVMLVVFGLNAPFQACGQISSLGAKQRKTLAGQPVEKPPREAPVRERNVTYERYSWITTKSTAPKTFKPGDLITIIVRQRRKFEADADLETKRKFTVKSDLEAFIKATQGGIGATAFQRGKPTVDYKFDTKLTSEGDTAREDRLTTRLAATILDVKPNGLLVLEGRGRLRHDDEISTITITGTCRKEDVTADNTVLSTQIADLDIVVLTEGALHAASSRGWVSKLLDLLKPI